MLFGALHAFLMIYMYSDDCSKTGCNIYEFEKYMVGATTYFDKILLKQCNDLFYKMFSCDVKNSMVEDS